MLLAKRRSDREDSVEDLPIVAVLIESRHNPVAVATLVEKQTDAGASWLSSSRHALRVSLAHGQLNRAQVVGEVVGALLRTRAERASDGSLKGTQFQGALPNVLHGIACVLDRDPRGGIGILQEIAQTDSCDDSLRWVAWLWVSRGAVEGGDSILALHAANEAVSLGEAIDETSARIGLQNAAEIKFWVGNHDEALLHLDSLMARLEKGADPDGWAKLWLTRARIALDNGQRQAAMESAERASAVAPNFVEAVAFIASCAMRERDLEKARALLTAVTTANNTTSVVAREMRLIRLVDDGVISAELLADYIGLRDSPPKADTVAKLAELAERHPDFLYLRESLAWGLMRIGRAEEAATHFDLIVAGAQDSELQRSALLGLGCLANRMSTSAQPGRWLRITNEVVADSSGPQRESRKTESAASIELIEEGIEEIEQVVDEMFVESSGPPPLPRSVEFENNDLKFTARVLSEPVDERSCNATQSRVSSKAAFTGQLTMLAVPDLLAFLSQSRRTGVLIVTSDSGLGAVCLRGGHITGAGAPKTEDLGTILVEIGVLSHDALRVVEQTPYDAALGEVLFGARLVEQGLATQDDVKSALRQQVLRALTELVSWRAGNFAFEPEGTPAREDPPDLSVTFDTQEMLLESLRLYDESSKP